MVYHALANQEHGIFTSHDKRGKHIPKNKTPDDKLKNVKDHIESFPVMDAHYIRKDTHRKYLGSDLSINKMYELYQEECNAKGNQSVSRGVYRKVFNENYNYSFHVPKKDQCAKCAAYNQAKLEDSVSDKMKKEYKIHQQNKKDAREEKDKDKLRSKTENSFYCFTFDLEAVLF